MSSSLDDLEPYEIFQNDLDLYLKKYTKYLLYILSENEVNRQNAIINHFIEEICFHKSIGSFKDLKTELIQKPEKPILDFLKFIQRNYMNEDEDLKRIIN